jgi:hypothetical protein
MKKSFLAITFSLSIFSLMISSCSKDSEDINNIEYSGTYILTMDNTKVAEGTTPGVGMLGNNISLSEGEDLGIALFAVPSTVGETYNIDDNNNSPITITGKNLLLNDSSVEYYLSVSGSITRVSSTKFSFQGVCEDLSGTTHSFDGEIESDVFKLI